MILSPKQQIGYAAQQQACRFLEKQGYRLVRENFDCRHGEIDLIMQDQEDIVFVEVRHRADTRHGNALESVNRGKTRKLIRTAIYFLQKTGFLNTRHSRFDVIAIHPIDGIMQLEWIKNAFPVDTFC